MHSLTVFTIVSCYINISSVSLVCLHNFNFALTLFCMVLQFLTESGWCPLIKWSLTLIGLYNMSMAFELI